MKVKCSILIVQSPYIANESTLEMSACVHDYPASDPSLTAMKVSNECTRCESMHQETGLYVLVKTARLIDILCCTTLCCVMPYCVISCWAVLGELCPAFYTIPSSSSSFFYYSRTLLPSHLDG